MNLPNVENEMKFWITMSNGNEMVKKIWFFNISPSTFNVKVPRDNIFIVSFDSNVWLCLDRCFILDLSSILSSRVRQKEFDNDVG